MRECTPDFENDQLLVIDQLDWIIDWLDIPLIAIYPF